MLLGVGLEIWIREWEWECVWGWEMGKGMSVEKNRNIEIEITMKWGINMKIEVKRILSYNLLLNRARDQEMTE